eukprot:3676655-Alexandrium_andersonii.AAC.1
MNVRATISQGIHVTELDARTPADVVAWFKESANSMNHIAAKQSFLEVYHAVDAVETAWRAECKATRDGISKFSGAEYEKRYF